MAQHHRENLGPLGALFGLLTQPGETAEALFEDRRPRHIFIFLFLGVLVFFGPMFYVSALHSPGAYDFSRIYSLLLIAFFTLLAFVVLEGLFLLVSGIAPTMREMFACAAYSLAPVIAGIIVIHSANYFMTGDFTFAQSIMGKAMTESRFGKFLPWAIGIIGLDVICVLLFSLKAIGDMHVFSALCMALLSALPLYGALLGGVICAEAAMPGSRAVFFAMLAAYTP